MFAASPWRAGRPQDPAPSADAEAGLARLALPLDHVVDLTGATPRRLLVGCEYQPTEDGEASLGATEEFAVRCRQHRR